MLVLSITAYLFLTLAIGAFASRLVKNETDFALAGRRLPIMLSASAFFATWFGAETVLGASSEFVKHGLLGVIEDPFGAALCLFLVGIFYARRLYNLNVISLGDMFRNRFGKKSEILSSVLMIISFFGWSAAQFIAFGLVLHFVAGTSIETGILIGAGMVIIYTVMGGMWAVSLTDFIQTIVIIGGMLIVLWQLLNISGGFDKVITKAPQGFMNMTPQGGMHDWLNYLAAWMTIGFGSIASQDVFQRVMATRSAKAAAGSAILGGVLYLTIAFIPLIIGLCALTLDPTLLEGDTQKFLPSVIMKYSPIWVQVLFFGALLSAILSSASAGILAPATILSENIVPYLFPGTKAARLFSLRVSVAFVAVCCWLVTFFNDNIFELVGESSALTLVSLLVPMTFGLFTNLGDGRTALISMLTGCVTWLACMYLETEIPPMLSGLAASTVSYLIFGMLFKTKRDDGRVSSSSPGV